MKDYMKLMKQVEQTIPSGILKINKNTAQVVYLSERMKQILGSGDDADDEWFSLLTENAGVMLSFRDIKRISQQAAERAGEPDNVIVFSVAAYDGKQVPVCGWISKEDKQEELMVAFVQSSHDSVEQISAKEIQEQNAVEKKPGSVSKENIHVFVKTFGYFEVFVDGKAISFRHEKAKELLAILIDRRGGYVSSTEAISYLWPNEPASQAVLSRYRKVAFRLKEFLMEYGIENIVNVTNRRRCIATDEITCDLYEYLDHPDSAEYQFSGTYMANYEWGEITVAELDRVVNE